VGLNRARGARRFEGDPAEANPSVGGHEHQRVPPLGEFLQTQDSGDRAGSRTVRCRAAAWATMETIVPIGGWRHRCVKTHYLRHADEDVDHWARRAPCRRPGYSEYDRQRSHRMRRTDHRRRMFGSATTAPTSTACFLYPALLWLEALRRGAVDGVFISRADGDNLKGGVVELAVDEPEPLRTLTRDVELDSGKPGQVAADVSLAQLFADDASVCEVVGDRHRGRDHL
jgi:hypothetical protein